MSKRTSYTELARFRPQEMERRYFDTRDSQRFYVARVDDGLPFGWYVDGDDNYVGPEMHIDPENLR